MYDEVSSRQVELAGHGTFLCMHFCPLTSNSSRFDGVWPRLSPRRLSSQNCRKLSKLDSRCVSSLDVTRVALIYTWGIPWCCVSCDNSKTSGIRLSSLLGI